MNINNHFVQQHGLTLFHSNTLCLFIGIAGYLIQQESKVMAASLGEFEQGLPLMEECKRRLPDCMRLKASEQAKAYVMNNTGATLRIMHQVLEDSISWLSPPVIFKSSF